MKVASGLYIEGYYFSEELGFGEKRNHQKIPLPIKPFFSFLSNSLYQNTFKDSIVVFSEKESFVPLFKNINDFYIFLAFWLNFEKEQKNSDIAFFKEIHDEIKKWKEDGINEIFFSLIH